VRDANGQALAYIYFEDEGPPHGDEATDQGRGAAHRGQLPELLCVAAVREQVLRIDAMHR
jgi:hypothetical protein